METFVKCNRATLALATINGLQVQDRQWADLRQRNLFETRQEELESIITAVRGLEDGKLFLASHEASFDLYNIEELFFCDLSLCFPTCLSLAHIFRWTTTPAVS